jgi:hypothetical protein
MPRDLFGDVTRPSISIGSRKWYTLPLSLFSHSAIVLLLIAIPILAPAVMPSVFADTDPVWLRVDMPKLPDIPRPKTTVLDPNPQLRPAHRRKRRPALRRRSRPSKPDGKGTAGQGSSTAFLIVTLCLRRRPS